MKVIRIGHPLVIVTLAYVTMSCHLLLAQESHVDPLPSWNEGAAKRAVFSFVEKVTQEGSPDFVPADDRIAVFDNDGTLWPENPLPFQLIFAVDELKRMAPEHPEWNQNTALQAALSGDVATLKKDLMKSLLEILAVTHAGMTTDDFDQRVRDWIESAKHARFDRHYNQLTYQPMQELLALLRDHGFKTYIVSGGGADFMRVWSEATYGIPPEQTIGSTGAVKYENVDGEPRLVKLPDVAFVDDKEGKPVAIHRHIGRRPIACFGNSDGDKAMLEWTTVGRSPSLGLIVHHTDAAREYAYDSAPKSSGKLIEALEQAPERGWVVVDMAKDWNRIWGDTSGSSPATTLTNTAWLVEDISGRGVIDNAQTTIQFGDAGVVSGSTGVNRFSGQARITPPALSVGPLATTRRAGPPALMDQETKFLVALDRVRSFRVDQNGLLFLLDEHGETVLRLSRMEPVVKP